MRSSTRALLTYQGLHPMILISPFLKLLNANRFSSRSRSLCSRPLTILGFHSRINLNKYMFCSYCDNCHDLVCVTTLLYPEDAISLKSTPHPLVLAFFTLHLPPLSLLLGWRSIIYVFHVGLTILNLLCKYLLNITISSYEYL